MELELQWLVESCGRPLVTNAVVEPSAWSYTAIAVAALTLRWSTIESGFRCGFRSLSVVTALAAAMVVDVPALAAVMADNLVIPCSPPSPSESLRGKLGQWLIASVETPWGAHSAEVELFGGLVDPLVFKYSIAVKT